MPIVNFLLIAVDSLRADRLGCYGCPRQTSPTIDGLAAQGTVFENCFAPGVPTQPSFTSLFTGQFPTTHGIVAHRGRWALDAGAPCLPEILRENGYATAAVDNLANDHQTWFSRGFETYINPRERGTFPDCFQFNRPAIDWLRDLRRDPFFLMVHYWDPHTPYMPPVSYRDLFYEGDPTTGNGGSLDDFYRRPLMDWWAPDWLDRMASDWPGATGPQITDIEFVRSQYDAEVRCADDGVAQLVGELEALGLLDETAVIVFGDHGEELGTHGIFFDHHGLYESNIRVPLVMKWPGASGGSRVESLVQHVDLAPTVLDGAGLSPSEEMDGHSLRGAIEGMDGVRGDDYLLTEECTWMAKWALREAGWKLIVAREPDFYGKPDRELYDLSADPEEQHNLAETEPARLQDMENRLEHLLAKRLARAGRTEDPVRSHGITLGKRMLG